MALLDPVASVLVPWQNFYLLVGTAAATLTGLMFVAVTFGASLVTRETAQTSRSFLDPTYQHFMQVLLTACLMTVPGIRPTLLGLLLCAVGLLRVASLWRVFGHYREAQRRAGDVEASDWVMAIVLPLLCHLWLVATGAAFVEGAGLAFPSLAAVTLTLLFVGIHGAWELFVWMALAVGERTRSGARPRSEEEAPEAPVVRAAGEEVR
jgi:hypothetical protein